MTTATAEPAILPKPRKFTPEEQTGNRLFRKLVNDAGGPEGYVKAQQREQDDQVKRARARAGEMMERNVADLAQKFSPRFTFCDVSQERWDDIFSSKGENHG